VNTTERREKFPGWPAVHGRTYDQIAACVAAAGGRRVPIAAVATALGCTPRTVSKRASEMRRLGRLAPVDEAGTLTLPPPQEATG
jgi:hypothetical protein